MLAVVPIETSSTGYPALQAVAGGSSAVSPEADEVRKAAREVINAAERSQALFAEKAAVISQLWALATECEEEGWDGSGAAAIDLDAVVMAERFLRVLPNRIPIPELAVEPDGSISLDWIRSRNHLFSVSVGRGSRLAFAWLDGADTGHGVAGFDGQNVPPRIREGIEAVVDTGYVALRAI